MFFAPRRCRETKKENSSSSSFPLYLFQLVVLRGQRGVLRGELGVLRRQGGVALLHRLVGVWVVSWGRKREGEKERERERVELLSEQKADESSSSSSSLLRRSLLLFLAEAEEGSCP